MADGVDDLFPKESDEAKNDEEVSKQPPIQRKRRRIVKTDTRANVSDETANRVKMWRFEMPATPPFGTFTLIALAKDEDDAKEKLKDKIVKESFDVPDTLVVQCIEEDCAMVW